MIETLHKRAIALAQTVRPLVRSSRPLVFHGTRYGRKILNENTLKFPAPGICSLHFSRQLPVGIYFALLDGRDNDEGVGAVFVLDRDRLARDYRVECYNADLPRQDSEADELIYARDIVRLDRYLTHTVWLHAGGKSIRVKPHSPRPSGEPRRKTEGGAARTARQAVGNRKKIGDSVGPPTWPDANVDLGAHRPPVSKVKRELTITHANLDPSAGLHRGHR